MTGPKTLGIVAGSGGLPFIAAKNAAAMGRRVVVSLIKETGATWRSKAAGRVESISIGNPSRTLSLFRSEGVEEVLIIGKVEKRLNFAQIEFDEMALPMLMKLNQRGDMNFSKVIIEEFSDLGFHVANQTDFLRDLLAPEGVVCGSLDGEAESDIRTGMRIARDIAKNDIGQTIAIRQGAVIAVEAFEHTNETIKRAGRLSGGGFVIVKAARPTQDFRFDVPAIGPETVRVLAKAGGKALAVEAGRTLIIDWARMVSAAAARGICVVGIRAD
jgi:UDP-2,3-diacylglucosamine hydrolase